MKKRQHKKYEKSHMSTRYNTTFKIIRQNALKASETHYRTVCTIITTKGSNLRYTWSTINTPNKSYL